MEVLFDGKKAYKHAKMLAADIGPRHGGSKEEAKAARAIRDYFKDLGLKSSLFSYKTHTFEDAKAMLKFPGLGEIECKPVACCESTPRALTRDVVFVESCHEMCLDQSMKGKILVTAEYPRHGKGLDALVKLAPAGVVFIAGNQVPKPQRQKARPATVRKHGSVPTVLVTYKDGMRIHKAKPKKGTLKVTTTGEKMGTSYNAIGELRGTTSPDEVIVVGGHYDSVWGGPGSMDNAGGTAIVMELARVFAKRGCSRTLRFIAFGAEEQGLCGSIAYVKKFRDKDQKLKKDKDFERDGLTTELDRIRFMINVDVQGGLIGSNKAWTCGPADLAASVRLLSAELCSPFELIDNQVYSSDNAPFGKVGVPSLAFARRSPAGGISGHSEADTIKNVHPESLDISGKFIEAWMNRYVDACKFFPFERKVSGATMKKIDQYFGGRDIFALFPESPEKQYGKKK